MSEIYPTCTRCSGLVIGPVSWVGPLAYHGVCARSAGAALLASIHTTEGALVLARKTVSERVQAMRTARGAQGLRRLELYAHPDDWPAIQQLAIKLQLRRAKAAAKADALTTK